ncbi:hypothetical protein [Nostoc sp.]|uniref:hypothetical protein n=1 Tax=Nostoc sp. TaxID=1180 RepID=UPI002FF5EA1B
MNMLSTKLDKRCIQLKYPRLDDVSLQMLKMLETNAKRGGDLVGQILSFTDGHEREHTIVLVSQLIEDIKQIAQQAFSKLIDIKTDIAPNVIQGFLVKPFTANELLSLVQTIFR